MSSRFGTLIHQHRERTACLLAGLLFVLTALSASRQWRGRAEPGPPRVAAPELVSPPDAPLLTEPLSHYWANAGRDPFGIAAAPSAAPAPAAASLLAVALVPPPPDPDPSLYRATALPVNAHLLTLTAAGPPELKDGRPSSIKPRPHDVVQAPGDPKPIEGTVRRDKDGNVVIQDGKVWFYTLKPKGMGHPKNPLPIADLLVYRLRAGSVRQVVQERAKEAGDNPDALVAIAQDCLNGDFLAEAEEVLKAAIRLNPRHRAAILKLADLQMAQKNRDAEIGMLRAALEADPDFAEAHARLGTRCLELGLLRRAGGHFARGFRAAAGAAIEQVAAGRRPVPDGALPRRLFRQAAEVRALQGHPDEAIRALERLAKAAGGDGPALRNALALAHLMARRPDLAIADLGPLAAAPKPPAPALNNLGAALYLSGDPAAALEKFIAARAADPTHAKAGLNAVLALAVTGNLADAEKALASFPEPHAPSLHRLLVAAYIDERQGRHDKALAAYQAAVTLDRASFHALCGLGRCHLAKGNREAAAQLFARARALLPDAPPAGGEVRRAFTFKSEKGDALPPGWRAVGAGAPAPLLRDNALHFEGRAKASTVRQIRRAVAIALPAQTGFVRRLARVEAAVRAPYTNQAVVGLFIAADEKASLQVGLRTTLQPKPSRRVAWRIVRNGAAEPWADLPGSVARDDFKLGLALSGPGRLDVLLDGKVIGRGIAFPELGTARATVEIGLFAAAEPGQECLCTVRQLDLVWTKAPVLGR